MEIAGYIASLVIGISLGLIGGGGSILTVPVLVYLFRIHPVTATAYSLFIVGSTSFVGSFPKYKRGEINLKTASLFGIPSIAAVYVTRALLVPAIPNNILSMGNFVLTKSLLMMLLFAILMVLASFSMIRNKKKLTTRPEKEQKNNHPLIIVEGIVLGMITGLIGAGGGFLLIPALVLLGKLPMKQAVGTSLVIIAANSLIGFTGNPGKASMNWTLLLTITGIAIAGIFIGNMLSKKVAANSLRKGFGWFVLAMGVYVIVKELLFSAITLRS